MSPCCSTYRLTTSAATAAWTATSPPSGASSMVRGRRRRRSSASMTSLAGASAPNSAQPATTACWSSPDGGASAAVSSPTTAAVGCDRGRAEADARPPSRRGPCPASTTARMPPPPMRRPRARRVDSTIAPRRSSTFPGLPHRQERIAALGGVTYVNDFEGDQRRCGRPRAGQLRIRLLDRRRTAEGRRAWRDLAVAGPGSPRVPDRRS